MIPLPPECDAVVLTEQQIAERVSELGLAVASEHEGEDLRLITVLKGGLFFLSDLCREVDLPLSVDFLSISPYRHGHSGSVQVTKDLDDDIAGASIVLVEDMVDTGLTLNYILRLLRERGAARVEVCALFDKPARRIAEVPLAYRGFSLADGFYVGYGLDLDGRYRNLPYLASVIEEVVCP